MTLQTMLITFLYCTIGCVLNGILNEDWQGFSILLILIWPIALFMILLFELMGLFIKIGEKIKKLVSW
jgi:hypothetical protein